MDDGRSGGGGSLRIGAIAAAAGLGMFTAYLLGLAGGTLVVLVLPLALAVFVIATLALLPPAAARHTQDDAGRKRFDLELERSRRHERPLGLLRITVPPIPGDDRRSSVDVAHVLDAVRVVDAVWVERQYVFVLMPETDRVALARALGRIVARLPASAPMRCASRSIRRTA